MTDEAGDDPHRHPSGLPPSIAGEIVDRYESGETLPQLRDAYPGISYRKLRAVLLAANVEMRPAMPVTPPAPEGLVAMYENGESIERAARAFGLSYGQTRRMLLNAGVVLRRRGRPG